MIPNHGEGDGLRAFVAHTAATNLILRLFSNNITPAETDTAATYTEASFTGYAAITLNGASWTVNEGAPSNATYARQQFTSTAGSQSASVYGAYMTRATSGRLAIAERFATGPFSINNNGDYIGITPNITFD